MGRTAVVTGAAQGVGFATASLLAHSGYTVVLTDIQELDAPLERLRSRQLQVRGFRGDVAAEDFAPRLAAMLDAEGLGADVLVNNAGISMIVPAEHTTAAQWRAVMDVNLLGPFLLCRQLGALMLKRRSGSIVNVASVAGLGGVSQRSAYNASKHGLIGLTRTLAAEWGGRGVRVNAVCPGWIKTGMDDAAQERGLYSDRDIVNRVPMARFATAEDVALAIAFLADSERSGFVNGACLPVDGGWTADAGWDSLRLATRD
jgi:NAD(P)-dependent dehydrogenase (short-subunit alcohol dehydrogenase family)